LVPGRSVRYGVELKIWFKKAHAILFSHGSSYTPLINRTDPFNSIIAASIR